MVLVSMVDDHRQVLKAAPGLVEPWSTRRQTGLSHSFCQHVATTAEPLVIDDARQDSRVRGDLAIEASVGGGGGLPHGVLGRPGEPIQGGVVGGG